MVEAVIGIRRVVGVRAPLGLGWRRAAHDAGSLVEVAVPANADRALFARRLERALRDEPRAVAVLGMHNADAGLADRMEDVLGDELRAVDVWLVGAGDLPNPLLASLTRMAEVGPLQGADFALLAGVPAPLVTDAHEYCGGRAEALALAEDRLVPSAELLQFVDDLRVSHPLAADLVLVAAATPGGVTVEELTGATTDVTAVLAEVRLAELFGLLRWRGARVMPASPVVADAVVRTEADRHRAALILSESPAARDSTSGTIAMLRARMPLQETQRVLVLNELRYLEMSRDLDRAEELIALLGDSAESDLQVAARSAMGRICIARGRGLPVDGVPHSQDANRLADAVVRLDGLDATAAARLGSAGPVGIFPGLALAPGAVSTTFDPFLLGVLGRPDEATAALDQLGDTVLDHAVRVVTLALCAPPSEALNVISEGSEHTLAHARGLACLFRSVAGDYVRAGSELTALVGPDWSATTPLFRLLGLWIAAGLDVELARRIAAHVEIPSENRMGSLVALIVRGQAEAVGGNGEGARGRFRRFWRRCSEAKLAGLMNIAAPYVLDSFFGTDDLEVVCNSDPIGILAPTVSFAQALRNKDVSEATAYVETMTDWPYRSAQGRVLVGRVCLDRGDTGDAQRHLAHAAAVFETLGAPVAHANTLKLLRSSGLRNIPTPRPRIGDSEQSGLGREAEILECLARGMTNKEIAAHLHIAFATVKRRVSDMLLKYDATNRRDLAMIARRHT